MPNLFYILLALCIVYDIIALISLFKDNQRPIKYDLRFCLTLLGFVLGMVSAFVIVALSIKEDVPSGWIIIPIVLWIPAIVLVFFVPIIAGKSSPDY